MPENLTRRDVLLSWALAEAMSPRWDSIYDGILEGGFAASAEALSPVEQAMLLHTVQTHRKGLIEEFINPAARFEYGVVQPDQIADLILMPWMTSRKKELRRVTLGQYVKGNYDRNFANDPRNVARAMFERTTASPYFGYPILAWHKDLKTDVIIEGYGRLIFGLMRHESGHPLSIPVIRCIH